MEVVNIKLRDLKPYENNPRKNDQAVDAVAESIKQCGYIAPIIVDEDNVILAGHTRYKALKKLGRKEAECIVKAGLTEEQKRKYRLLDNKTNEFSEWDLDLLADELEGLDFGDFDFGFDLGEDEQQQEVTEDEYEAEPPAEPKAKLGDIYQLGRHRLMCGDSTDEKAVKVLFNEKQPFCIVTDPPYCSGGFQEAGKKSGSIGTRDTIMIANDCLSTRGYTALIKNTLLCAGQVGIVYIFTDWRMWVNLFDCVESSGFGVRNMIVWNKETPGMGVGWRMQHELCLLGSRSAVKFNPHKATGNVISCKRTGNINHPTEKPVELIAKILDTTDMCEEIFDPFGGSGTTLIACEQLDRTCYMMELDPRYVDVIIDRWEKFTGQTAKLISEV